MHYITELQCKKVAFEKRRTFQLQFLALYLPPSHQPSSHAGGILDYHPWQPTHSLKLIVRYTGPKKGLLRKFNGLRFE